MESQNCWCAKSQTPEAIHIQPNQTPQWEGPVILRVDNKWHEFSWLSHPSFSEKNTALILTPSFTGAETCQNHHLLTYKTTPNDQFLNGKYGFGGAAMPFSTPPRIPWRDLFCLKLLDLQKNTWKSQLPFREGQSKVSLSERLVVEASTHLVYEIIPNVTG